MICVKRIEKDDWKHISHDAHVAVFGEVWNADLERIEYALVTTDQNETLVQYATIRETDGLSAYIQYGGSFPSYKGTVKSYESYKAILGYLYERYERVSFVTENTNFPMLKFAIKEKFKIVGMKVHNNQLMLEHCRIKGE